MQKPVDFLRSLCVEPKYFGLGFIQFKVDLYNRYHVWCPELTKTVPEEEVHDHRYNFTSYLLYGQLCHTTYNYKIGVGDYVKLPVSCDPKDPIDYSLSINKPIECHLYKSADYVLVEGSSYFFGMNEFHKTIATTAITHLVRQPTVKRYANVIRKKDGASICPFQSPYTTTKLWEMIDSV